MLTHSDLLQYEALKELTTEEISCMEHCIGWDKNKIYTRSGTRYFRPYRNFYDPGGKDRDIWKSIKEKGFASCNEKNNCYWLKHEGLDILSAIEKVYIYSENAIGNKVDASSDVLHVLLNDSVYCGYGCWFPTSGKEISKRARLPYKLTMETLHYLADKGYVNKTYYGDCNEDGIYCKHGWELSEKWIDEHKELYEKRQKEEYEYINKTLREETEEVTDEDTGICKK